MGGVLAAIAAAAKAGGMGNLLLWCLGFVLVLGFFGVCLFVVCFVNLFGCLSLLLFYFVLFYN
jgi:hypothetical protein